jgi:hypothetical protein
MAAAFRRNPCAELQAEPMEEALKLEIDFTINRHCDLTKMRSTKQRSWRSGWSIVNLPMKIV